MNNDINKNLLHTQNNYTQRMNITRIILPVQLLQSTHIRSPPFVLYKPFVSGDVMFSLRYHRHLYQTRQASPAVSNLLPAYSCHVNLQTLNYIMLNVQTTILLKFQHEMFVMDNKPEEAAQMLAQNNNISNINELPWLQWLTQIYLGISTQSDFTMFLSDLLPKDQNDVEKIRNMSSMKMNELFKAKVLKIMMTLFRISGIFIGSEYQGGQHQGDLNPCSHNPVDHSAAMQIAGKYEKVRNMWATCDRGVSSGDVLGFRLKNIANPQLGFELSGNPQTSKIVSVDRMQVDQLQDAKTVKWHLLVPSVIGSELPSMDEHDSSAFGAACCYTIGLVNQMSKAVLSTEQLEIVAINAMSCAQHTNTEVLLQFSMPNFEKVSRMTMHDIPRRIAVFLAPDAQPDLDVNVDGQGIGFGSGSVGGEVSSFGDGIPQVRGIGGFGGDAGSLGEAPRGRRSGSNGPGRRNGGIGNPASTGAASVENDTGASTVSKEVPDVAPAPAPATSAASGRQLPRSERVHERFITLQLATPDDLVGKDKEVQTLDGELLLAVENLFSTGPSTFKKISANSPLFPSLEKIHENKMNYVAAGEKIYHVVYRKTQHV
jgi:hypothetical protein